MDENFPNSEMKTIEAVLVRGYEIASGRSGKDKRFPEGTIKMQKPFFAERGLDFDKYFSGNFVCGTLNLSIAPNTFEILKPEYFFKEVKWTEIFPPENFFLSKARIIFKDSSYKALIYIPDPSTKPDHFQGSSIIEVIAETIKDINYGDSVKLFYNQNAIKVNTKK